ncbi:hypothetical protein CAEBREN_24644 [Caenorhabditis brenneri]|uniref:Peptidase A1 domain-containing protein n=1 Tax=Caenorhabditis brenneri TaxID=135651 RepID=G0N395_CAEBE|nr:hypothetical protein CAEBREN_24644 [Caenorhabditis brenneri]
MKVLLALLLLSLLEFSTAKSFSHPIRRSGSLRSRLLKNGKYQNFLAEQHKLKSGSQPFVDFSDDFYLVEINIGTPPVKFTLSLDTGSSFLWVLDSDCTSRNCHGDPTFGSFKVAYNKSESSTFQNGAGDFSTLFDNRQLLGYLAKDVVSYTPDLTIALHDFGSAKNVPQLYLEQPFDGVMGFGLPAQEVKNSTTPLQNLMPLLDQQLFHIWMDRKFGDVSGKNGGLITYGALDTVNCDSNINYVPLSEKYYWGFFMNSFTMGSYKRATKEQVISDTGSGWLGAPTAVITAVVKATGALYDWPLELYTVPCSTMQTQPDLVFNIGGIDYTIKSVEYILDLNLGNGNCALAMFGMAGSGFGPRWVLGDVFIREYCHVFDYGSSRVGLSKAIHSA